MPSTIVGLAKHFSAATAVLIALLFWTVFKFACVSIDNSLWETDKCPACYGDLSCNYLKTNLVLDEWSIWNLINAKNVYYGRMMEGGQVVIKKLASTRELEEFDRIICDLLNSSCTGISVSDVWLNFVSHKLILNENDAVKTLRSVLNELKFRTESSGFETGVISCLSDRFLKLILQQMKSSQAPDTVIQVANLATILIINPEPIMQQIVSDRLPKLLGVCGRMIVEEYVGPTLSEFLWSPWKVRLRFAASLIELANELTLHNSTGFAIYLTDVSFDNFAVSSSNGDHNTMKVKLIDGESVVIVDPASVDTNNYHINDFEQFNSELSFSADDLCSASWADHNYYAICKCLLSETPCSPGFSGGLLRDLPNEVEERWQIKHLVTSCVNGYENRYKTSQSLLHSIRALIDDGYR